MMVLLEFFIDINLPIALWPLTEMSTRRISCGEVRPVRKADNLPMPLSWNLGTLTSWNPLGHSLPVTGLLYLYV